MTNRLAKLVTARRRWLIRRIVGIQENRYDWNLDASKQPIMNKAECMAFAQSLRQAVGTGQIKIFDQALDQMLGERRMGRVLARLVWLIVPGRCLARPLRPIVVGERNIANCLASVEQDGRHVAVAKKLLLIIANDDQNIQTRIAHGRGKLCNRGHRKTMAPLDHLCGQFFFDLRVGQREQFVVRHGAPGLIEVGAFVVTFDEAQPVAWRCVQHRRVGGADSEQDAGHIAEFQKWNYILI